MQNLELQLFRNDNVVSVQLAGDESDHLDANICNRSLGHLAGLIYNDIRRDSILISNHWADQLLALVASFLHFTPHARRYLNEIDYADYPEGVPLANNDGSLTGSFGYSITFTGYTHDAERASRGHRLSRVSLRNLEYDPRFHHSNFAYHTTSIQHAYNDNQFIQRFRSKRKGDFPSVINPYVRTIVRVSDFTDPR